MSVKAEQVAEPVAKPEESGSLNSVGKAPGADRLEFIRGLITESAPSEAAADSETSDEV